jgi:hypothetical protein
MDWWVQLSQIILGFVLAAAAVVGAFLAWRGIPPARRQADAATSQAELARRTHVLELFNRAVSQLADAKLEIRLGAIYTLRYIADDFPDLGRPVIELLTTYLRESVADYGDADPPIDVREIMAILRTRTSDER